MLNMCNRIVPATRGTPFGSQRGVTMIEVLVAVVILAFGVLGIVGLETAALRYQKAAWSRANTAALTMDIAERIRANLAGARQAAYRLAAGHQHMQSTAALKFAPDSALTPDQVAERDIAEWAAEVAHKLPQGTAHLSGGIESGYVATLMWKDKEFTQASAVCKDPGIEGAERHCCPFDAGSGIRCLRTAFLP